MKKINRINDYTKLLNEAITKSIEYTDYFVKE